MNVCPALVRRETELQMLASNLGVGGLFLVTGEAGIGKSRLLRALADHAEEHDVCVLWGRPEVLADPGPYSFIGGLLDEASRVGRLRSEAREISESLFGVVDVAPRQAAARIRGLFAGLDLPPLVLLEDLQDADELSLAVVAHLARATVDDRVTVVGTFRPEASPALGRVLEACERDRLATFIELGPLDRDAVAEMLRLMWNRDPTGSELDGIVKLAEGVPFLTEELASTGAGVLPESVLRAVESRLGSLEPEARRVVEVASLIVGAIDPGLIAEVGMVPEARLPEHLVAAVRVGLLADREGRLVFRHGLLRKAVAESLVSVDRAALHQRLAAEIERRVEDPSAHASALTRHYFEAGNRGAASGWAVVAGTRALAVAALDDARSQFQLALDAAVDPATRLAAREGLCEVLSRTNPQDPPDWGSLAVDFEELGDPAAAARCWVRHADVERVRAGDEASLPHFERALTLLSEEEHPEELAQVLIEMGVASVGIDGDRIWERNLQRGLSIAEAAGRQDLAAEALVGLGRGWSLAGELDTALSLEQKGCEAALSTEQGSVISKLFKQHAWTLLYAGRGDDALGALDEAESWARRHVGDAAALNINLRRAHVYYSTGQPAKAAEAAARLGASTGAYDLVALARFYALLECEGEAEARAYLSAWWDLLGQEQRQVCLTNPEIGLEAFPTALLACVAEMLVADTEAPAGWWSTISERYCSYYSVSPPATRMDILIALGYAAIRLDSETMMSRILQEMTEPIERAPYPPFLAARKQLHGASMARSKEAGAVDVLWSATEDFIKLKNAVEAARTASMALAAVEGPSQVRPLLATEALGLAVEAGAATQRARLEGVMRAQGIRRKAGRPRGRPKAREGELSIREEEVAVLVAAGATNAEVARRLVLSERTVEDHIARAQRRLGVTGRAGLAAWAAKRGLV